MAICQSAEIPVIIEFPVKCAFIIQDSPCRIHLGTDVGVQFSRVGKENLSPVLGFNIFLVLEIAIQSHRGILNIKSENKQAVRHHAAELGLIIKSVPRSVENLNRSQHIPHMRIQKFLQIRSYRGIWDEIFVLLPGLARYNDGQRRNDSAYILEKSHRKDSSILPI